MSNSHLAELLNELLHGLPLGLDGGLQLALQLRLVGRHAVPVEGVVPHLSGVVEDTSGGSLHQLVQRSTSLRKQVVEVVHVATHDSQKAQRPTSGGACRSGS